MFHAFADLAVERVSWTLNNEEHLVEQLRHHLPQGGVRQQGNYMSIQPMLAVIPARGGSEGVPGKNIRPLAGLPLIAHSIRLSKMCAEIAKCIVSTDSEEIAAVARECGAEVSFLRPGLLRRTIHPCGRCSNMR